MKIIKLFKKTGNFAENKDLARNIRIKEIIPEFEEGKGIILDFEGIDAVTQSFIHALISDLFRKYNNNVLDRLMFKSCNDTIKKIINIVIEYMQERE
ncbi:MAG: STAS-like domain-containing protein [Patescibacteria group bacterium]|jgi:hypothetical protein